MGTVWLRLRVSIIRLCWWGACWGCGVPPLCETGVVVSFSCCFGGSVDLGGGSVLEAGLVPAPVVERFDVVEQDRAQLRTGHVLPWSVDVADVGACKKFCVRDPSTEQLGRGAWLFEEDSCYDFQ